MNLRKIVKKYFFIHIIFTPLLFSQAGFYHPINLDTVSWSLEDFGKLVVNVQTLANDVAALNETLNTLIQNLRS